MSDNIKIIWSNLSVDDVLIPMDRRLSDAEWQLAKSVFQGVALLDETSIDVETGQI